jgi:WhiB family redox-sensing transcriptional regulator
MEQPEGPDVTFTRWQASQAALLITRGHWRSAAACRSADPELFFPISDSGKSLKQIAKAKAICAGCPVRRECLTFALRTQQVYGIWGGTTEKERAITRQRVIGEERHFALERRSVR